MTSILTTLETDFSKAVAFLKNGAADVGEETLTIIESVGEAAWPQTLALLKESHIGTAVENSLSAVKAAGGDIVKALPTIIANTTTLIAQLKAEGGTVIGGIEDEAEAFATALVADLKTDFLDNTVVAQIAAAL